ncbi:MAG: phosphatidate cytidylyltransferase [Clostridia bacterium]|nr:phosphatidate cytidylyltransferase [Clostridia bacterium]
MKTRIISALVGTVVLLVVLFCPWAWVFTVAAAVAAAIAVYELLHNTGIVKNKTLLFGSMAFAVLELLAVSRAVERSNHEYMLNPPLALLFAILDALPVLLLVLYGLFVLVTFLVHRQPSIWKGFALTLYVTLGFLALAALRDDPQFGLAYCLLPLVIAWMSDTGAYFTGVFFGKHKMAPVISPKKTWEGFFGGWIISIGLTAVYGLVCNALINPSTTSPVDIGQFAVFAAVLAPLSVVGDLLASVIKRRCGIKDYGNIMPGHGGVMDRFDSVVFIAPLVYIVLISISVN